VKGGGHISLGLRLLFRYVYVLNLFGKAVCGKVAISVDKLKQPTKITHFSNGTTFTAITTRTDAYKFSFFPLQFVNGTHSHPIRG